MVVEGRRASHVGRWMFLVPVFGFREKMARTKIVPFHSVVQKTCSFLRSVTRLFIDSFVGPARACPTVGCNSGVIERDYYTSLG